MSCEKAISARQDTLDSGAFPTSYSKLSYTKNWPSYTIYTFTDLGYVPHDTGLFVFEEQAWRLAK